MAGARHTTVSLERVCGEPGETVALVGRPDESTLRVLAAAGEGVGAALAGLRVGYALGHPDVIAAIDEALAAQLAHLGGHRLADRLKPGERAGRRQPARSASAVR